MTQHTPTTADLKQTQTAIKSVVIIGSGNLAEALVMALADSPFQLRQIFARNAERGAELARIGSSEWCNNPIHLALADLYIVAVSDRAVESVTSSLPLPEECIVAHTAGCVDIKALPCKIKNRAVIYPLQTFTHGRKINFQDTPLFIETSNSTLQATVELFARGLSRVVMPANSAIRRRIHLAGVFANNFANDMFVAGAQIMQEAGLSYDLLKPIIEETAAKAISTADPTKMQTGPAVRCDTSTQQSHSALLSDNQTLEIIYKSISKHIWETSKKI